MIRPFTCVCMLLAAGSGLYLYQTKHRGQLLDRDIMATIRQTEAVRERTNVLHGEYALLSEPDRLQELTAQHLGLRPLSPTQFVTLAELGGRLPPPLPPGGPVPPAGTTDEPAPDPVAAAHPPAQRFAGATPPAATLPAAAAAALPPAAAPASRPAASTVAALARPAPRPAPATALVARTALPPPTPVVAPVQAPAPRITAPVVSVSATPYVPPPNSIGDSVARVARGLPPLTAVGLAPAPRMAAGTGPARMGPASVAPAPVLAPGPAAVASVLGGPRTALPAPVPYASAR